MNNQSQWWWLLSHMHLLINGVGGVESLLDPGSQIVSMSNAVTTALQVTLHPDMTVHMESANKLLEKNVPFKFGPITVYLQVHMIEKVVYKVLLGRPFDNTVRPMGSEKSYSGSAIYVGYIVPLWLEIYILVIHLCEIYCTLAVGKSYLSHPFMWGI